ncbi:hypothetical protein J6590_079283 [Homalodisca vitripennis]|nr:hypothetical protein J6590_079283 [Homalodisca vitripennis]
MVAICRQRSPPSRPPPPLPTLPSLCAAVLPPKVAPTTKTGPHFIATCLLITPCLFLAEGRLKQGVKAQPSPQQVVPSLINPHPLETRVGFLTIVLLLDTWHLATGSIIRTQNKGGRERVRREGFLFLKLLLHTQQFAVSTTEYGTVVYQGRIKTNSQGFFLEIGGALISREKGNLEVEFSSVHLPLGAVLGITNLKSWTTELYSYEEIKKSRRQVCVIVRFQTIHKEKEELELNPSHYSYVMC